MNSPSLIVRLALGGKPTDVELANELYEVCDRVHSSCDNECPVYELNGHAVPAGGHYGCTTFKHGPAMLAFIRSHSP